MARMASEETLPLLRDGTLHRTMGEESENAKARNKAYRGVSSIYGFFRSGIFASDATTYDPIYMLLNADDQEEKDALTEQWRDYKLKELNFIGVMAALLAGVLTSTGSWPHLLPAERATPWPARTAWFCGLVLALTSITTAADHYIRLCRLSTHRDSMERIRQLLSGIKVREDNESPGEVRPKRLQIYIWQLPVLLLTASVICMILGMLFLCWAATIERWPDEPWFDDNARIALAVSIVTAVCGMIFIASQISLYLEGNSWGPL
ncbi:hypothetical protein M501DRAFT_1018319 [Patellaria atrata CBS 101060]|uniref:Uncharacterized protein n=1 Tax=Patellaria atrata CBS 101060 TaxID=1346257 RepID=A0A9P4VKZ0_9PEZI|nr:hypothetical protein M501DRAFT_1018319 [Patellaria atrata CBS 101060]